MRNKLLEYKASALPFITSPESFKRHRVKILNLHLKYKTTRRRTRPSVLGSEQYIQNNLPIASVYFPFRDTKSFPLTRFSIYANMGVYKGHLSEKCKPFASAWFYLALNQRGCGILHCPRWWWSGTAATAVVGGVFGKTDTSVLLLKAGLFRTKKENNQTNAEGQRIMLAVACILIFFLAFHISFKKGTMKNV